MEKIREYMKDPKIVAIAALVVGILIGWFIIGWGIWTVSYVDADLINLREDVQKRTMKQVIDAYAQNGDAEDAITSWVGFGNKAVEVYSAVKSTDELPEANIKYFEQLLTAQNIKFPTEESQAEVITDAEAPSDTGEENVTILPTPEPDKQKGSSFLGILLGVLFILFLAGAGALAYFFFFKGKGNQSSNRQRGTKRSASAPRESNDQTEQGEFDTFETEDGMIYEDDGQYASTSSQHLRQFVTEYVYGNDLYDDTFSIDAATGEFLGECGVGISDTIGNSEPKNVTAFEVWLFDKNDVQTVTKVLMSEYAMNNPGILQRLEVKGEPVQIRPDTVVVLETATLKLEARVLDVTYGRGGQADRSFIQQMQVELTITSRESLG